MISARKLQLPKRQAAVVVPPKKSDHQEISPTVVDTPQSGAPGTFRPPPLDSIDKTAGMEKVTYWRLSFRLTHSGTTAVVWQDDYEIKKQSIVADVYR